MKSKKITLEAVQQGTLSQKIHQTELKQRLKEMAKNHNSASLTTDFFLCTSHTFEEEQIGFLLVLGETKSNWKQYKKQVAKNQKRQVLMGKCFLEIVPKQAPILQLIPLAGKAPFREVVKAGKNIFKKHKFSCNFFQAIAEEEDIVSNSTTSPKEITKSLVTAYQAVGQSSNKLAQLFVVSDLLEKAKESLVNTPVEDKKEAKKIEATLQQITTKMQPHESTLVEKKALLHDKFLALLSDFNQLGSSQHLTFTLPSPKK